MMKVIQNKRFILFVFIILVAFVLKSSHWMTAVTEVDTWITYIQSMGSDHFVITAMIYTGLTVLGSVLLALPGITFAVIASALFPPLVATVLCAFAAAIGAGIAFLVGRFFLKDSIGQYARRSEVLNRFLFNQSTDHPVRLLMITRLLPIFPFNIQNFAYGMTDIAFRTYFWCTFVFIIPGTAMYTFGTSGLINLIKDGSSKGIHMGSMKYFAITILAGLTLYWLTKYLNRKYINIGSQGGESPIEPLGQGNEINQCTSCGMCTGACSFLQKYHLDFSDLKVLKDHAYECFLCGQCRDVCPEGVDGRQIMVDLRRQVSTEKPQVLWRYPGVILEKKRYLFGNRLKKSDDVKSLVYWGCNFPSLYPQTTEKLRGLMRAVGTDSLFDCCGKPIEELGLYEDGRHIIEGLNKRLESLGIEELIFVCPNCYHHLEGKLPIKMVTIYDKLAKLGFDTQSIEAEKPVFPPCPDRGSGRWFETIKPFMEGDPDFLKDPQCCGAGGCGGVRSPEIAKAFRTGIEAETTYVYCATCAGEFGRGGQTRPKHILSEILNVNEDPAIVLPLKNRIKFKFK